MYWPDADGDGNDQLAQRLDGKLHTSAPMMNSSRLAASISASPILCTWPQALPVTASRQPILLAYEARIPYIPRSDCWSPSCGRSVGRATPRPLQPGATFRFIFFLGAIS